MTVRGRGSANRPELALWWTGHVGCNKKT